MAGIKHDPHWREALRHMRRPWWVIAFLLVLALVCAWNLTWCLYSGLTTTPLKYYPGRHSATHVRPPWAHTDVMCDAFSGEWWWMTIENLVIFSFLAGLVALDYRNGWIVHQMNLDREAEERREAARAL